jgi:hypothetical protein
MLKKLQGWCQEWIVKAQQRQGTQYNKKHANTPQLREGDQVWLSSTDLSTD